MIDIFSDMMKAFHHLSQWLGANDWKRFMRALGMSATDIGTMVVRCQPEATSEKIFICLSEWYRSHSNMTVQDLYQPLIECQLRLFADELKIIFNP